MIITLCGSARFEHLFRHYDEVLTLQGHVVFNLSVYPSQKASKDWYTPHQKLALDAAHMAKIAASDAILVLNKDGYIGESTTREVLFAKAAQKEIYALEPHALEASIPYIFANPVEDLA